MKGPWIITVVILAIIITLIILYGDRGQRNGGPQSKGEEISKAELGQRTPAWNAVSLRVLNEKVEQYMASGDCPGFILRLCGITKVNGFMIDSGGSGQTGDVILVGEADDSLPPLNLNDLVIALRNAWRKYAKSEGNIYYYLSPGCSIDPTPGVLAELQQVAGRIFRASSSGSLVGIQQWYEVCSQPQEVRVMGVPRNTRFAKVIVDADYYMKRLVDGSISLGIEGFTNLMDMKLDTAKEIIIRGRSVPAQMNRFWFFPGENKYSEGDGVVLIKRCEVKLLTEEEFFTRGGKVSGSGRADPLAKVFGDSFTEKYAEIARKRQIYAEQESLFRLVSLAQAMRYRNALEEAGIDLDYLMNRYPVEETSMPETLPGVSKVREFHYGASIPSRCLWMLSFGGVSIDIRVSDNDFEKDPGRSGSDLRRDVLENRPSHETIHWPQETREHQEMLKELGYYNGELDGVSRSNYKNSIRSFQRDRGLEATGIIDPETEAQLSDVSSNKARIRSINQRNRGIVVFTVELVGREGLSKYVVNSGEGKPIYEGNNISKIVKKVNEQVLSGGGVSDVYLDMKGFSIDRAEAFATSCRIANENKNLSIQAIHRRSNLTTDQDVIFSSRIEFEMPRVSAPEPVTSGEHAGQYKVEASFFYKARQVIVRIFTSSMQAAQEVYNRIRNFFFSPSVQDMSLGEYISHIHSEIKEKYKDEDIEIEIQQFESIQIIHTTPEKEIALCMR